MAGVSGSSTARSASLSLGWINPDPGGGSAIRRESEFSTRLKLAGLAAPAPPTPVRGAAHR